MKHFYSFNSVIFIFLLCVLTVTNALAGTGLKIHGFVGQSSTMPASGATVKLIQGSTGQVVDIVQTNFFGKYKFKNLNPGYYRLISGEITREVMLKKKDIRLDIDLSAKSGNMNYAKDGIQDLMNTISGKGTAGNATASGPNDPNLQRYMAGSYFSFSGGGYGSHGGSSNSLTLCPDGRFNRSSESGYSGGLSGGGSWGTANQSGNSGKWTINGDKMNGRITLFNADGSQHSFKYQDCSQESSGCFYFDGVKFGWGQAKCR
ncbi:MAG: carboxypeptidase regulatory-like domain-containing protein [Gammaproteobacteria bacterium]|nr:carboxypeptidase regulatory-like domain-containing protein [Gammaproteobacteria bacterium]